MALPDIEFLLESSMRSLEDLELSARNRSANLSKAVRAELDAWIEQQAAAMLVRWMIEHRQELMRMCPPQQSFAFGSQPTPLPHAGSALPVSFRGYEKVRAG